MIKKLIIVLILIQVIGCTREVYTYSNEYGRSKFTIYKDNYKYEEETKDRSFNCWGKYEIGDSTITFILKERDNIPFPYLLNQTERLNSNESSDYIEFKVVDFETNEPIIFAGIGLKDSLNRVISGISTDFDGKAKIKKAENTEFVEFEYLGYATHRIDYEICNNYNILMKMEKLEKGGRLSEGCLLTYVDFLLEYRIDNPDQIGTLKRHGIIYEKDKTP